MNIQIEYIIVAAIILIFLLWATWFRLSRKWLKHKYTPEKDRGRNNDGKKERTEGRTSGRKRVREFEDTEPDSPRPPQLEKPRVLQTADISPAGENSISNRKTGKGTRGFFRKFRRK